MKKHIITLIIIGICSVLGIIYLLRLFTINNQNQILNTTLTTSSNNRTQKTLEYKQQQLFSLGLDSYNTKVQEWFDYLKSDSLDWNANSEISIEDYSNVTFQRTPDKIEAIIASENVELYTGNPVWNTYFRDYTGDGKPELCSTISTDSETNSKTIIIYDYVNNTVYKLTDSDNNDYVLALRDNKLVVEKYISGQQEPISIGQLFIYNGTLLMTETTQ